MIKRCILYFSVNTHLAYFISTNFYDNTHYVWCSPVFDPSRLDKLDYRSHIPVSSSPVKIYQYFHEEISSADIHGVNIERNKAGLLRGALQKWYDEKISDEELDRITYIVNNASKEKFFPMLYLIPADLVEDRITKVDAKDMANPLSEEYIIEDLKTEEFEIVIY